MSGFDHDQTTGSEIHWLQLRCGFRPRRFYYRCFRCFHHWLGSHNRRRYDHWRRGRLVRDESQLTLIDLADRYRCVAFHVRLAACAFQRILRSGLSWALRTRRAYSATAATTWAVASLRTLTLFYTRSGWRIIRWHF